MLSQNRLLQQNPQAMQQLTQPFQVIIFFQFLRAIARTKQDGNRSSSRANYCVIAPIRAPLVLYFLFANLDFLPLGG